MMIAHTVMALIAALPSAAAFAVALEIADPHAGTSSITAAAAGGHAIATSLVARNSPYDPVTDAMVGTSADGEAMLRRAFDGASVIAHSDPLHAAAPAKSAPQGAVRDSAAATAPAPASIWVVGIGLIGVAGIARRRSEAPRESPATEAAMNV